MTSYTGWQKKAKIKKDKLSIARKRKVWSSARERAQYESYELEIIKMKQMQKILNIWEILTRMESVTPNSEHSWDQQKKHSKKGAEKRGHFVRDKEKNAGLPCGIHPLIRH